MTLTQVIKHTSIFSVITNSFCFSLGLIFLVKYKIIKFDSLIFCSIFGITLLCLITLCSWNDRTFPEGARFLCHLHRLLAILSTCGLSLVLEWFILSIFFAIFPTPEMRWHREKIRQKKEQIKRQKAAEKKRISDENSLLKKQKDQLAEAKIAIQEKEQAIKTYQQEINDLKSQNLPFNLYPGSSLILERVDRERIAKEEQERKEEERQELREKKENERRMREEERRWERNRKENERRAREELKTQQKYR